MRAVSRLSRHLCSAPGATVSASEWHRQRPAGNPTSPRRKARRGPRCGINRKRSASPDGSASVRSRLGIAAVHRDLHFDEAAFADQTVIGLAMRVPGAENAPKLEPPRTSVRSGESIPLRVIEMPVARTSAFSSTVEIFSSDPTPCQFWPFHTTLPGPDHKYMFRRPWSPARIWREGLGSPASRPAFRQ